MDWTNQKFITVCVGVLVAIIMTSGLVIPIVSDAAIVTYTYNNAPNAQEVLDLVDGEEVVLFEKSTEWHKDGSSLYTCNVYTSNGYLFFSTSTLKGTCAFGDVKTTTSMSVNSATKVTVTPTTLEVITPSGTYTTSIDWAYVSEATGQYGLIENHIYTKNLEDVRFLRSFNPYIAVMEGDTAWYHNDVFEGYLEYRELPVGYDVELPAVVSDNWTVDAAIAPLKFSEEMQSQYSAMFAIIPLLMITLIVVTMAAYIKNKR